jgi:hypothetical protein
MSQGQQLQVLHFPQLPALTFLLCFKKLQGKKTKVHGAQQLCLWEKSLQ